MNRDTAAARASRSNSSTRFPDEVIVALHDAQVTATCMPIQLDNGDWQAAVFMVVDPESPCVRSGKLPGGPFTVGLDVDLHEHPNSAVVELMVDVRTRPESLHATLLLISGHSSGHFDSLKLLATQSALPLFIGDAYCQLLWQQQVPLNDAARQGFKAVLDDAVRLDAITRLSGHYDPDRAFSDIVAGMRWM